MTCFFVSVWRHWDIYYIFFKGKNAHGRLLGLLCSSCYKDCRLYFRLKGSKISFYKMHPMHTISTVFQFVTHAPTEACITVSNRIRICAHTWDQLPYRAQPHEWVRNTPVNLQSSQWITKTRVLFNAFYLLQMLHYSGETNHCIVISNKVSWHCIIVGVIL